MSKSEEETKKINLCDDMVMASPVSWSTDTNTDGTRRFQRRVNQKQIIMNFSEECNKLIPNIVGPFEVRLIRKEISKKKHPVQLSSPLVFYLQPLLIIYFYLHMLCILNSFNISGVCQYWSLEYLCACYPGPSPLAGVGGCTHPTLQV